MEGVRAHFRPEFLNRLDEIVLFHRLGQQHMGGIVDIQVARVQKLLADRKVTLDLTDAARDWLGRAGYEPVYGAGQLQQIGRAWSTEGGCQAVSLSGGAVTLKKKNKKKKKND